MNKMALTLLVLAGCTTQCKSPHASEIQAYTDSLAEQQTSAMDYVFQLFDHYDIVILCERDHRDITQYVLFLDILGDDRFADIRNIYFEIGNSVYNDTLNRFLHNPHLTPAQVDESVMSFHRNSYGPPLWEKANYSYYLNGVYDINKILPEGSKISVRGLDIGVDWATATIEDLKERDNLQAVRDSILGNRLIRYFDEQDTDKALVVLNYRHAFLQDMFGHDNAGRYIAERYKGRVANVFINSFIITQDPDFPDNVALVHDGKWDAAFRKAGKDDLGFDFDGTPFGRDTFDLMPFANDRTYGDVFTGFIYYRYFPDIRAVSGMENFIDDRFATELMRRYELEREIYGNELPDIDDLKTDYNTVETEIYRDAFPYLLGYIDKWL